MNHTLQRFVLFLAIAAFASVAQAGPWDCVESNPWACVETVKPGLVPAPHWVPIGQPEPVMVTVRSCGGGMCRLVKQPNGQKAQLYRWSESDTQAHAISAAGGLLGWWIYDGPQPRWAVAGK